MKNVIKKIKMTTACFLIGLLLCQLCPARALAASAQTIKTRSISSTAVKKVADSQKKPNLCFLESNGKALAAIKQDYSGTWFLYLLKGTSETRVNLTKVLRSKLSLSSSADPKLFGLTGYNGVFYLSGRYSSQHFLAKISSSGSISVKKIDKALVSGKSTQWSVYKKSGQFLLIPESIEKKKNTSTGKYSFNYYVSSDAKSWKAKKISPSSEAKNNNWDIYGYTLISVTGKAVYFQEYCTDSVKKPFIYTTDLKSYKTISSINKAVDIFSKPNQQHDYEGCYRAADGVKLGGDKFGFNLLSKDLADGVGEQSRCENDSMSGSLYTSLSGVGFKKIMNYNGYMCPLKSGDTKYVPSYLYSYQIKDRKDVLLGKYYYLINTESGTFVKYETSLNARLINDSCVSKGIHYMLYNGNTLLVSKNNDKTIYKIKLGKSGLAKMRILGDKIYFFKNCSGYEYYVPVSKITKAIS